jgi:aryl-alcohol dehydrogenase-like predicted oxidoreductase
MLPDLITKPIPSSGEELPVIGIGTSRRYEVGTSEGERYPLRNVVDSFVAMGGRVIDTAAGYGSAEIVVGDLVEELGVRDQVFFATKTGAGGDGTEAAVVEIERSFERLHTDVIDLMYVHNLQGWQEMFPVLREMKQEGRIRYYGTTTTPREDDYAELLQILQEEPLDFIEMDYAIDNRGVEERVLPMAADQGVAVFVALPFGRGRVFSALGDQDVPDWAQELGIETWAQFALKYVVSHPAVTVAIPGTAKMEYVADNINAALGRLPDEATRQRMVSLVEG